LLFLCSWLLHNVAVCSIISPGHFFNEFYMPKNDIGQQLGNKNRQKSEIGQQKREK